MNEIIWIHINTTNTHIHKHTITIAHNNGDDRFTEPVLFAIHLGQATISSSNSGAPKICLGHLTWRPLMWSPSGQANQVIKMQEMRKLGYIYMGICDYHDIIWYNNSLIIWLRNSYLNSLERVREHPWIHGFLSSLSRQVSPPLHLENCPKTGQWPWKGDGETNRETHPRWSGTMWHHLTDPTISPKAPGRHSTCARARINDLDSSTEI